MNPLPASQAVASTGSSRFPVADAMRAAAIVFVLTSHTFYFASQRLVQRQVGTALGDWGVAALFVLSGFLLGRPFVEAVLGRRRTPDTRAFAERRFLRIWPAYAVMVVVNALVSALHHSKHAVSIGDVVTHLLLIHTLFVRYLGGLDAPYWTLAVEAQFYVAMPLIAHALVRWGPPETRSRAMRLKAAIGATILISLTWRVVTAIAMPVTDPNLCFVWYRTGVGMAMCFALGAAVAMSAADDTIVSARVARSCVTAGLLLLGAMVPVAIFCPNVPVEKLMLDLLGSISASAILFGCVRRMPVANSRRKVPALVSSIAANSYALYLTHYTLLTLLKSGFGAYLHDTALEIAIVGGFVASAPLVAVTYRRFVERPFLTLKDRVRPSTSRAHHRGTVTTLRTTT